MHMRVKDPLSRKPSLSDKFSMRDQKILSILGALAVVLLVAFLLPHQSVIRQESLVITTPCVLQRFNQKTLTWEKISKGSIRSKDLLATASEGCEVETSFGALELAPETVTSVEKSSEGWVAEVQTGRVVEIGSHRWQIVSPALRAAPMWFSPSLRAPSQLM